VGQEPLGGVDDVLGGVEGFGGFGGADGLVGVGEVLDLVAPAAQSTVGGEGGAELGTDGAFDGDVPAAGRRAQPLVGQESGAGQASGVVGEDERVRRVGREQGDCAEARVLKQWKAAFLAYFSTGRASNGGTEAINGLIELHRRVARGFRNRENYRLRMLLIAGGLDPKTP